MTVDDVEVVIEGAGPKAIVMIHGWPDTHRLWDAQVAALKDRYRCVRFTLPGFDLAQPGRAHSLDEVVGTIRRVVERACPGERVTLLVHDWGCFFGYQFATRHPQLVERVIGVDIGDAGSRRNLAAMSLRQKLMVVGYQCLARAGLAHRRARRRRHGTLDRRRDALPSASPHTIGAQMGYPYAVQWFKVKGGFDTPRAFDPAVPMLFFYGERKPFMFHSQAWLDKIAARPGSRVIGLRTGHWVMLQKPAEFNDAVRTWLADTDARIEGAPA